MNTQPTNSVQPTDDTAIGALARDKAEDTISDVYLNLIKIANHLSLLRRALHGDLEVSQISKGVADLYLENLEAIEETLEQTQKNAVRVMCFFNGDSCD